MTMRFTIVKNAISRKQ